MIAEAEAVRLVARAQKGDRAARAELAEACRPLVKQVTRRVARKIWHVDREDLEQEGWVGLLQALDSYDIDSGRSLGVYLWVAVWRAEMRAVCDEYRHGVTIPRVAQKYMMGVARVVKQLTDQLGRSPTLEELMEAKGLPRDLTRGKPRVVRRRLECILQVMRPPLELDAPSESDARLAELLKSDDPAPEVIEQISQEERRDQFARAVQRLSPQQKLVLESFYLSGLARKDWPNCAAALGLELPQIWNNYDKAVRVLRKVNWLRE